MAHSIFWNGIKHIGVILICCWSYIHTGPDEIRKQDPASGSKVATLTRCRSRKERHLADYVGFFFALNEDYQIVSIFQKLVEA